MLPDIGLRQLESVLGEHVAESGQALFQCLTYFGLGAAEIGVNAFAVQAHADFDRAQFLRVDTDMGVA